MIIGTVPSLLIAILALIRKVEYFIFFYVGFSYISHGGTKETAVKFLRIMFIILAIIGFLQIFGFIGSFNMGNYDFTFGDRASATFNGAYEYAAYLVTMICFFMYDLVDKRGIGQLKTINFVLLMVAILRVFVIPSIESVFV